MDKQAILTNGLTIVTHGMPEAQSAAVGIWIRTGGRYESLDNKGVSHFLEHLFFKGSKKYSCRQIKESVEGVGGALNAFTAEEVTCFLAKVPAAHLNGTLAILGDMVLHPLMQQEDIDKERTVILEEIKMYKDLPQHYVYDILDRLLWPSQPLGLPIIGSAESVLGLTREAIHAYKQQTYTPANIVIAIAGAFSHTAQVGKIKKIFGSLKKTDTHTPAAAAQNQDVPQLDLLAKDTEQTHLALGFHAFKRDHPLKTALSLLHVIMGGNMSSRLFNAVREERGLAYEIGTQVRRFADTGAFIVHAGIDNQKVPQAMKLIFEELNKATHTVVTPDELTRAKDFYLGQLTLALEDTMDYMLWMGENMVTLKKTYSLSTIRKEVERVTRGDIRVAACRILQNNKINCALIGPRQLDRQALQRILRIG